MPARRSSSDHSGLPDRGGTAPAVEYRPLIRDMPSGERPRERLRQSGASALSNAELLAIILRTGAAGENVSTARTDASAAVDSQIDPPSPVANLTLYE